MSCPDSAAPRPEPAGGRTPLVPPAVAVAFVLVSLAAMVHWAWSLLAPPLLEDPRPEVRSFVHAVRDGVANTADLAALMAYRNTLPEGERQALAYEVNYLLYRDRRPLRFAFGVEGEIVQLPPGVTVADVASSYFRGPILRVEPAATPPQKPAEPAASSAPPATAVPGDAESKLVELKVNEPKTVEPKVPLKLPGSTAPVRPETPAPCARPEPRPAPPVDAPKTSKKKG